MSAITLPVILPVYLVTSFMVVAYEDSDRYVEAAAVTAVTTPVLIYLMILPGLNALRPAEKWAAGDDVDRVQALQGTYIWSRRAVIRAVLYTRSGQRSSRRSSA
jgi:adenylate cyclase